MKTTPLSLLVIISIAITASSCRKKENKSDDPAPSAQTPPTEPGPAGSEPEKETKTATTTPEEVDEDDVLANLPPPQAGALALALTSPTISFVEADAEGEAGRGFSLLASDFDNAYEYKYRWDPAQAPLKSLNNNLQVVSNTGYAAFIGKGKRIAKMKLGDIFGAEGGGETAAGGTDGGGKQGGGEGGSADTPVDIVFEAAQTDDGKIVVKIWFTRTIDSSDPSFWQFSQNEPIDELDLNYYAMVTIHKNSRQVPPYGVFDFIYEMRPVVQGEEATAAAVQGYVIVSDKDGQVSVKYRERNASRYSYLANGTEEVTYEYSTTQLATALLSTESKKVVGGTARTASQYESHLVEGTDPFGYSEWKDESGSYSLAFHKQDGLADSLDKQGASVTKWVPSGEWFNQENYGEFDPTALRCEEIGSEVPSTFSYGLYDAATGAKIPHKTYLGLYKEGDTNWSGCWMSRWGSSCYGDIESGDTLKSYEGESYTVELMAGSLIDMSEGWEDVTQATTGDLTLTCASQCPKAGITQADLDSQWLAGSSMYVADGTVYTFDGETKTLSYNSGASVVGFSSADDIQWGWVSVNLTEDGSGKSFMYQMSTDNKPAIAKDSDGNLFVPAGPIEFTDEAFVESKFAREGSLHHPSIATLHDATQYFYEGFVETIDVMPLQMENGWINIGYFQSDMKDQWGWQRYMPNITFKKGAILTVDSDPDGNGPITAGQKVKLAPLFTETIPQLRASSDCKQSLRDQAEAADEQSMPMPAALKDDGNNVREQIGAKPDGSFPVVTVEGEIVATE